MQPLSNYSQFDLAKLAELEQKISRQVKAKQEEVFGDREVVVQEGDPLYDELDQAIAELIKPYPADSNGSRYICSTVKVCPTLKINLSRFYGVFKEAAPGNLFLDEVGKAIDFGPLENPLLGSFTTGNTTLKLKNIRFKPGAIMRANEFTTLENSDKKVIAINAQRTFGAIDTNPELQKTEFVANVIFGDFKAQNMEIPVETLGDDETTELVIALPPIVTKIAYDGTITLPNGTVCKVEDLVGPEPREWVNYELSIVVPFYA